MHPVDSLQLNFNRDTLIILNIVLGLIMFGIALDLRVADFKRVIKKPFAPLIGLLAQFIVLPAVTFGLTLLLAVPPSVALGMILVGSCPGGNISNFATHISGGNTALSVSMTAISTAAAIVMTPLNITLWGGLHPEASKLIQTIAVDPWQILLAVFFMLGIPLVAGVAVSEKLPKFASHLKKPFRYASLAFFAVFVVLAFAANWRNFLGYIHYALAAVLIHNACAFATGYGLSFLSRLPEYDRRAITIEVGIQNSGLGLTLIFDFFAGLGGMALIAGVWGIWHIIGGMSLAGFWSRRPAHRHPTDEHIETG